MQTEQQILKLLEHKDPTGLQMAVPHIILENWDTHTLMAGIQASALPQPNNIIARATALCAASLLLLDVAPTWGIWDRPERKRKIRKMLDILQSFNQNMGEDEWQGPEDETEQKEIYTDVFLKSCGWKTHWPLCDFLREIELHKQHKYNC